jgi:hypothetical protein
MKQLHVFSAAPSTSSGATFGPDGTASPYRYRLWREWDPALPRVAFIMLNPSTADASLDDPTIRRCIGFAKSWGFGSLEVANLFALRSPSPADLRRAADPVGPENDAALAEVSGRAQLLVAAWGVHGTFLQRDAEVRRLLAAVPLHSLRLTKSGHPAHPLYLPATLTPTPWSAA